MESSEDKTKRKFAKYLLDPMWTYQYSIFYETPEDSVTLLDDQKLFRRELGRKFPNQPFLIRIQTLKTYKRGNVLQGYLTLYTTQKTLGFIELVDRYFPASMSVTYRQLTERRREVKAHKILTQKPHDLTKLFGSVRIRRYGVINKHLLTDLEE
jgi:hypothetical protein